MTFTFGIVTDTHVRPEGGDQSSPYAVNDLANGRAGYAARLLAAQGPSFAVHLGDVVHPLPHLPSYGAACEAAKALLAPLGPDLRFAPGNHDIGDKPHDVSPAGPVTDETTARYGDAFGPAWQAFDHGGARFVILNSSLVNLGSEAEREQRDWLQAELAAQAGRRVFVFSHYPPFIESAEEPEHYDNYAEPGRGWLLDLCVRYGVEAVFSGHVHHFFYNRFGATKFYCLPATSFTRQDYAELFPVAPAPEYGRDDRGKFGVTLVDVTEDGHRLRVVPTDGQGAAEAPVAASAPVPRTPLVPHLRHAWARAVDLPYNGPMEEFSRKRARDDYPLLRLWQMGIDTVRTPLADLVDPETRARMLDWATTGIRFTLFTADAPTPDEIAMLHEHGAIVAGLERAVRGGVEMGDLATMSFPVRIGLIQTSAAQAGEGSRFTHAVSFGYRSGEVVAAIEHVQGAHVQGTDGIGATFQIDAAEDIDTARAAIARFAGETGRPLGIVIRLADANPAVARDDDDWTLARVRAALALAEAMPDAEVQIDTFTSVDRGYSPRRGLLDRLSNPTPAGRWLMERG